MRIFHYTSTTTEKLLNYVVLACVDGKEALITMHCDINDCPAYAEKFMKGAVKKQPEKSLRFM